MPQAGRSVSPGRTHRGDEDQERGDTRRPAEHRSRPSRPRAVPAQLASIGDVTAELDFTPRPRPRRTSGPVSSRTSAPRAPRAWASATPAPVSAAPVATPATRATPGSPAARDIDSVPTSRTAELPAFVAGAGVAGRRTVTIKGRGAERYHPPAQRRRPTRRPHEREGFRPDRVAMWAVMLGFILVLVAATSSHAATIARHSARAHVQAAHVHHVTLPASAFRAGHRASR